MQHLVRVRIEVRVRVRTRARRRARARARTRAGARVRARASALGVQHLDEAVAERRLPLLRLRAQDEGPAHLEVGEGVLEEHVLHDDRRRVGRHRAPLPVRG